MEIIESGVNGYLYASNEELKKYLVQLITDANLRQRIGLKGRATIEQRYSVKANAEKYLDLFH